MPNDNKAVQAPLDDKKCAIYIRVSTHWQVDKDSLDVQRRELQAYAQMVLRINDFVVFEDAGYSAKNTDRPDYQKMMARLRSGEFSHLLVWKIDRISRNLLDFSSMYAELKSLGIAFVSMNEQFDTSTAIGEAMLKIILVFAELERNMTAERVTAVMLSRANNGQWNGGRVPYGYRYDKNTGTFDLEPSEAGVCRIIYDLYDKGSFSLLDITRDLNSKGFLTRKGGKWSPNTIRKILTSPWYIGEYNYNVTEGGNGKPKRDKSEWIRIENHHEPLIDPIRFEQIQNRLARNMRGAQKDTRTVERKHVHIFAGLLKCGYCGANMTASQDRRRVSGWRPSIYACRDRRRKGSNCSNKYVSDATLGPFVFTFISNLIRAKGKIGPRTTLDELEGILLNSPLLSNLHIDDKSLFELKTLLLSGETGVEYKAPTSDKSLYPVQSEIEALRRKLQNDRRALARLENAYLYSESGMAEKDYIVQRNSIIVSLEKSEKALAKLEADSANEDFNEQEFIEKASYFVMAERLLSDEPLDYMESFAKIDPAAPRAFARRTIEEIVVSDGQVKSIQFKNGIQCCFTPTEA